MAKTLARAGDWLLGRILPGTEAGACVPENGHDCFCDCQSHWLYRYNCHGACYAWAQVCSC